MGNRGGGPQMQFSMMVPVTPVVRWMIGINVGVWVILQLILDGYFFPGVMVNFFGLIPEHVFSRFYIWQIVSYMFLHSVTNYSHVIFNMLMVWWLGSELESRWGSRFFLLYYMATGVGAALIYGILALLAAVVSRSGSAIEMWQSPVVGASGAIFGLLLAYGIIFGERVVYFMMVFPMKAKYFVMILGGAEIVALLANGNRGDVANLAHLGGLLSGFLFLTFYTRLQQYRWRKQSDRRGRNLKLVVNNDKKDQDKGSGPRYWN